MGDIDKFEVYNNYYLNSPTSTIATEILGTKQINVSWSTVPGTISYNIYRSETSGSGYVKIGSSNTLTYLDNDSTLTYGKTYYYVIMLLVQLVLG